MQEVSKLKIFIAYTTIDNEVDKNLLTKIENQLKFNSDVYIDLLHNDNKLNPQKKVMDELKSSDILIVLHTDSIQKSKWVELELKEARKRKKKIKFITITDLLNNDFEL